MPLWKVCAEPGLPRSWSQAWDCLGHPACHSLTLAPAAQTPESCPAPRTLLLCLDEHLVPQQQASVFCVVSSILEAWLARFLAQEAGAGPLPPSLCLSPLPTAVSQPRSLVSSLLALLTWWALCLPRTSLQGSQLHLGQRGELTASWEARRAWVFPPLPPARGGCFTSVGLGAASWHCELRPLSSPQFTV